MKKRKKVLEVVHARAMSNGVKFYAQRQRGYIAISTVDENGKITIDDVAAGEDIRKIERAQAILQNALQSLRAAQTEGANSKGQTAQAIYDKSQELINQIQRLDNNLEETTNYIRHVLAVYKAKDEMLKAIMASQNMV